MALHFVSRERKTAPIVSVGKGIAAGVAGTAVMTLAQQKIVPMGFWERLPSFYEPKEPRYPDEPQAKDEASTEVAARRLVEGVAHRPIGGGKQQKLAGNVMHFAMGAGWGGLLGLVAARRPRLRHGLLFGTLVWAVNDNLILPALRLADWPRRYPLSVHLRAWFAHLVFGAGTVLALRREMR